MPRDVPVGNGKLLVAFDEDHVLRDIYYPHVGRENHSGGRRFRFGVWVGGRMSWLGRDGWDIRQAYVPDTLLTDVVATSRDLAVRLAMNDAVDYWEDVYLRRIAVENLAGEPREVRLFFHHDFRLLETGLGDTAYFDPDEKAVIHYKVDRYFLMNGTRRDGLGIDGYATGLKEIHSLEGTWRDAEDGRLESGAIAQGTVDSVLSLSVRLPAEGREVVHYWICAGETYEAVSRLNKMVQGHGPEYFLTRTENSWRAWLRKEDFRLEGLPPRVTKVFADSLLILRTNIDAGGAIVAANDSDIQADDRDTYSYVWPRDAALTAYALDLAGYHGLSRGFFDFCFDIVRRGKESVGYFLHKYNPDKSLGSSWHPWLRDGSKQLPIQEDGTALILWALGRHFELARDVEFAIKVYKELIIRCGDFLASYRDERTKLPLPCYDLWEEAWGVHTFTVSTVYGGLRAAQGFAAFLGEAKRARIYGGAADEIRGAADRYLFDRGRGRFLRSLRPAAGGESLEPDPEVDASLYAPAYFGLFPPDDERIEGTMAAIRERLAVQTPIGGLARYAGDRYRSVPTGSAELPGNPWLICTAWMAQWRIARARRLEDLGEALPLLEWIAAKALPSGVLSEQIHPLTGRPISVAPLTWSHASFVAAVLEYRNKREELAGGAGARPPRGRKPTGG